VYVKNKLINKVVTYLVNLYIVLQQVGFSIR